MNTTQSPDVPSRYIVAPKGGSIAVHLRWHEGECIGVGVAVLNTDRDVHDHLGTGRRAIDRDEAFRFVNAERTAELVQELNDALSAPGADAASGWEPMTALADELGSYCESEGGVPGIAERSNTRY